jgi:peptide-methionine (S)-S-oxide reductase
MDKDHPKLETIVLAGGCFWGVEAVFEHTKGVVDAVSGYAGGKADTANYDTVCSGKTGHAEAVKITYDPAQISLDKLLDIFFNVAHNPTQLNHQGPDHGTQYRSAIFYANDDQKKTVESKITVLDQARAFSDPIVTKLERLEQFYPAEPYHQNYAAQNPMQPYIVIHDAPKVKKLKSSYPELYEEKK